jgi:hypothetical protein
LLSMQADSRIASPALPVTRRYPFRLTGAVLRCPRTSPGLADTLD